MIETIIYFTTKLANININNVCKAFECPIPNTIYNY